MLLAGKIAIIAGDAYGVGRATAQLFAREGASVTLIDDEAAPAGATSIPFDGTDVAFVHADLAQPAQVRAAAGACRARMDRVDVLFNVAGRSPTHQSFSDTSEATWRTMIDRNLTSVFLCSQEFLPLLQRSASGCIINHASIDAMFGNPGLAAYSAAKGGVLPLTHCMARDLARFGIRANSICTGGIRGPGAPLTAADRMRLAVTPIGRMGTPQDIAKVALFLASDLSSYVNGTEIIVDGGRTATTHGCYEDGAGSLSA